MCRASWQRCRYTRYTDTLLDLPYLGMQPVNTVQGKPGCSTPLDDGCASPELLDPDCSCRPPALVFFAAIMNYYKLSGSKIQHNFLMLQFWRSEVWNGSYGAKIEMLAQLRSFWRFQGRICPLPFPAAGGCLHYLVEHSKLFMLSHLLLSLRPFLPPS